MDNIRSKVMDNKIIFYLSILLAGMILIVGLTGCDDTECKPCTGFGCLKIFDDDCPAGYKRQGRNSNPDIAACPSTDFITMENREICNEEFCVAIVDEYVECERIDCFAIECYTGE